jgi:hypothetical protein
VILFEDNPGGRDVHDEIDVILTERYLRDQGWTESSVPQHLRTGNNGGGN